MKAVIDLRDARTFSLSARRRILPHAFILRKGDYMLSLRSESMFRTARHPKVWSLQALESFESLDVSRDQCERDFTKLPFSLATAPSPLSLSLSLSLACLLAILFLFNYNI